MVECVCMKQIFLLRGLETAAAEYRWRFSCSGRRDDFPRASWRTRQASAEVVSHIPLFSSSSFWIHLSRVDWRVQIAGITCTLGSWRAGLCREICWGRQRRHMREAHGQIWGRQTESAGSTSHPTGLASPCPVNWAKKILNPPKL